MGSKFPFLCRGPCQMECITSSHSNMRYWPIMTHLLCQTVQRTCSSNVGPQISSNAIIFSHSNANIWPIMTHIHIRKPSENFYLVRSPAENVFAAASQITPLNYYVMRIATNSDAINKSGH